MTQRDIASWDCPFAHALPLPPACVDQLPDERRNQLRSLGFHV